MNLNSGEPIYLCKEPINFVHIEQFHLNKAIKRRTQFLHTHFYNFINIKVVLSTVYLWPV